MAHTPKVSTSKDPVEQPTNQNNELPQGIIVFAVRFHQAFDIAGMTATSLYRKRNAGADLIEMVYTPAGLFGKIKTHKFVVPLSNVVVAYFE